MKSGSPLSKVSAAASSAMKKKKFTGKAPVPFKSHYKTGFRLVEASGEVTDRCDACELGTVLPLASPRSLRRERAHLRDVRPARAVPWNRQTQGITECPQLPLEHSCPADSIATALGNPNPTRITACGGGEESSGRISLKYTFISYFKQ